MQTDHFDVVIVGAGLSGIGAACHLRRKCPTKTFVLLDRRDAIGGTWDIFRYPGVRSDSDMHTLGYDFKPWKAAKAIADGPAILDYVRETAVENDVERHIRFHHLVESASWDSASCRWTVTARRTEHGDTASFTCNFLYMCAGYYSYEGGHLPEFPGIESYRGTVAHPQAWPEDLEYRDKRVVVIGSGATAMTLVPAMAENGAQVAMVQRSPTYVVSRPDEDAIANRLRRLLPERLAYAITRWKNVTLGRFFYHNTRVRPERVKAMLLKGVRAALGPDYDVGTHFTPRYNPWDQRLCLIPNADLFRTINSGAVEVVTDTIDTFTEDGLRLDSGRELPADIVVTATGLRLVAVGNVAFEVDGEPVRFPDTVAYKGTMYSGVPNLASTFGYINASWTLRADLIARFVCKVLNHMDATGTRRCTPRLREGDRGMALRPFVDDFSSGYFARALDLLPKQGDRDPWRNTQNYAYERKLIGRARLDDGALVFEGPAEPVSEANQEVQRVAAGG